MAAVSLQGGVPLSGDIVISGAKNSGLKLLHAALFSNEDVVLDNIPNIENLHVDLEIIRRLGGKFRWIGANKLVINGAGLISHEIPYELGSKYRTAALLVGPLVFRFGKAILPKPGGCKIGPRPLNRWVDTWKTLGYEVQEDDKFYYIFSKQVTGADISFKISTHTGTDNAILSALFAAGETTITNAAEEPEVDDLIAFCNQIGGKVERVAPRTIKVSGTQVFKSCKYKVMPDRNEVVTFVVAALVTGGNIKLKGVQKTDLLAFTNVLTKIGCKFEFAKNDMRVWHAGEVFSAATVTTAPAPGFMTDWQPLITLLLTQAEGESIVHDTVYTDRFGYTVDLNRMGAKINLVSPSELGLEAVISDEAYDLAKLGEPKTVAKITGPTPFKGTKLFVPDLRAGAALVLAGLMAHGKSEIEGVENVERGYENFFDKLVSLGAQIEKA